MTNFQNDFIPKFLYKMSSKVVELNKCLQYKKLKFNHAVINVFYIPKHCLNKINKPALELFLTN